MAGAIQRFMGRIGGGLAAFAEPISRVKQPAQWAAAERIAMLSPAELASLEAQNRMAGLQADRFGQMTPLVIDRTLADTAAVRAGTGQTLFDTRRGEALLPGEVAQQGATLRSTDAATAHQKYLTEHGRGQMPHQIEGLRLGNIRYGLETAPYIAGLHEANRATAAGADLTGAQTAGVRAATRAAEAEAAELARQRAQQIAGSKQIEALRERGLLPQIGPGILENVTPPAWALPQPATPSQPASPSIPAGQTQSARSTIGGETSVPLPEPGQFNQDIGVGPGAGRQDLATPLVTGPGIGPADTRQRRRHGTGGDPGYWTSGADTTPRGRRAAERRGTVDYSKVGKHADLEVEKSLSPQERGAKQEIDGAIEQAKTNLPPEAVIYLSGLHDAVLSKLHLARTDPTLNAWARQAVEQEALQDMQILSQMLQQFGVLRGGQGGRFTATGMTTQTGHPLALRLNQATGEADFVYPGGPGPNDIPLGARRERVPG